MKTNGCVTYVSYIHHPTYKALHRHTNHSTRVLRGAVVMRSYVTHPAIRPAHRDRPAGYHA
ncbi:hypothetical protein GCM10029964_038980 [Kibdelosporangium lantanae]